MSLTLPRSIKPRYAVIAALAGASALILAFAAWQVFGGDRATVILTSGEAGTINPSGEQQLKIGSEFMVRVEAVEDTIDWEIGLLVDGEPVAMESDGDAYSYQLTVTGPHRIAATFVDYAAETVVLDDESWSLLEAAGPDTAFLEFSSATPDLERVEVGSVVTPSFAVSDSRKVIARVIEVYETAGGGIGFETEPASLLDLFESVSIHAIFPLEVEAAVASLAEAPPRVSADRSETLVQVNLSHSFEGTCPRSGGRCGLDVEATLDIEDPDMEFRLEMRWFDVHAFQAQIRGGFDFDTSVEFGAGGEWSGEKRIVRVPIGSFIFPIGIIPVHVSPGIDVEGGASVDVLASLKFDGSVSARVILGPRLENGAWSIGTIDANAEGSLTADRSLQAEGQVFAEIEPGIEVYGLCGAEIEVRLPSFQLEGEMTFADGGSLSLYHELGLDDVNVWCGDHRLEFEMPEFAEVRVLLAETSRPGATPSPRPTATPTPRPTATPTRAPTSTPTPRPSPSPNDEVSIDPSLPYGGISLYACGWDADFTEQLCGRVPISGVATGPGGFYDPVTPTGVVSFEELADFAGCGDIWVTISMVDSSGPVSVWDAAPGDLFGISDEECLAYIAPTKATLGD